MRRFWRWLVGEKAPRATITKIVFLEDRNVGTLVLDDMSAIHDAGSGVSIDAVDGFEVGDSVVFGSDYPPVWVRAWRRIRRQS